MADQQWFEDPILTKPYRGDVELIQQQLFPGEQVRHVATASDRLLRKGVLALTNKRLLFVRERALARPVLVSVERDAISDARIADRHVAGKLVVRTGESEYAFDLVSPRMRTWNFYWDLTGVSNPAPDTPYRHP